MSIAEAIRPETKAELRYARMLIGGAWVDSVSSRTLEVENPAKRQRIGEVPGGAAEDVDKAVAAAARAFSPWNKTGPYRY